MKYLWIAPRYPTREQITFFRNRLNDGKFVNFDFIPNVYGYDVEQYADEYDVFIGTTDVLGIYLLNRHNKSFYKVVQIKYAPYKYRFLGFAKIYNIDLVRAPSVGKRVVYISRHNVRDDVRRRLIELGAEEVINVKKVTTSVDTVRSIVNRYRADDFVWITNVAFYNDLINKYKMFPLRAQYTVGSDMDIFRITRLGLKMYLVGDSVHYI